jgi:uncharacterized membrane protein (DUF4010 family)
MPHLDILFARFGLALVLGFLIGLEREREKEQVFAGMRTFALISLLGAALAFTGEQFAGPWLFPLGFAVVAAFALLSHFRGYEVGHIGITTEVAFLLAFLMGAMVYWDLLTLAAAITVVVVLVLTFKPNLQTLLANIGREDIWAGLEFAIVWIIVLPLLPNETYGPLDVLNPREIWLTVVLVAATNLFGYVLAHIYGVQRSIGLTGIIGGLISSTAVTFDFSRRSRKSEESAFTNLFTLAIAIASAGMYMRVIVLTLFINSILGAALAPSMLLGAAIMLVGSAILWWQSRQIVGEPETETPDPAQERSPFALRPALQFGLIFAIVLWVSKAAQVYLAETGLYLSGFLGGIAGLDAVTLSMARLSTNSGTTLQIAVRSITLGASANMLFKAGISIALGAGEVRRKIWPLFVLATAASVFVAFVVVP